ncbi:MAG: ABC transporter ATP-binding protein [Hydrogenophilales bacterium RIFOXYD1_FULL_62_11]|nr:MAG: ABC transporter ATP-binding protein [Hydrogenophilales bacterium RIFOXYD1_FULL_62_11]
MATHGARLIELRKVSKTYPGAGGGFTALNRVDLEFSAGEYVAIVGKSGSGKSTLLNMLTGIDHPSNGTVVINGVDVHTLDESALASWRGKSIGIVFQFFQLIPTLTILENLLLAMDFVKVIPKNERQHRAERLLEQVGIVQHGHKLPSALSGGEQQRAAIARALANDPPIVVADEPTGNLDSQTTEVIQNLFKQLADAGKTVIVVTHDKIASARFDRVVTLKDGVVESDQKRATEEQGALP